MLGNIGLARGTQPFASDELAHRFLSFEQAVEDHYPTRMRERIENRSELLRPTFLLQAHRSGRELSGISLYLYIRNILYSTLGSVWRA